MKKGFILPLLFFPIFVIGIILTVLLSSVWTFISIGQLSNINEYNEQNTIVLEQPLVTENIDDTVNSKKNKTVSCDLKLESGDVLKLNIDVEYYYDISDNGNIESIDIVATSEPVAKLYTEKNSTINSYFYKIDNSGDSMVLTETFTIRADGSVLEPITVSLYVDKNILE